MAVDPDDLTSIGVDLSDLSNLDVEAYTAAHDFPDISEQVPDVDGLNAYSVDYRTAIRHLSVDKYESVASTVREYVSNMSATCLEARDYLGDDYNPMILIAWYPESGRLIMEDNGMGFGEDEMDIGTQMGVSTNRFNPDRGGKYGIGLLSGINAVGLDGAFFHETRSRRTDDHKKGIWTGWGFFDSSSDEVAINLPDQLGPDQYGSRFEFVLDDPDVNLTTEIPRIARYSRIPILYQIRREDGTVERDDEFGGRSDTPFLDRYSETESAIVIDEGPVRIVTSPHAEGDTVSLDVPVDRNFDYHDENSRDANAPNGGGVINEIELPYTKNGAENIDILFRSEDDDIIAGPHEGRARIGAGEWDDVPEDYRDRYVPADHCSTDDVWTPPIAGDRDRLERHPEFHRWVAEHLEAETYDRLMAVLEQAVERGGFMEVDDDLIKWVIGFARFHNPSYNSHLDFRMVSSQIGRFGVEEDYVNRASNDQERDQRASEIQKLKKDIEFYSDPVDFCPRDINDTSTKDGREEMTFAEMHQRRRDRGGHVWMAVRPSNRKANVAWADHPESDVVAVGSDRIEQYQEFGWRELNYIREATLDEFDVPDELKEPFRTEYRSDPNAGRDAPDREISLHRLRRTRDGEFLQYSDKLDAAGLRDHFAAVESGGVPEAIASGELSEDHKDVDGMDRLILFPSNSEWNISDFKDWYPVLGTRMATCSVMVAEYLEDTPRVTTIEEVKDRAESYELPTSRGEIPMADACEAAEDTVFHLVPDSVIDGFRRPPQINEAAEWFKQNPRMGVPWNPLDDVIYVPVTREDLDVMKFVLRRDGAHLWSIEESYPIPEDYALGGRMVGAGSPRASMETKRDTPLYAYASLRRWRDTSEYELLRDQDNSLSRGGKDLIDGFHQLHQMGVEPPSEADSIDDWTRRIGGGR